MPYDDITQQTDALSGLAQQGGGGPMGAEGIQGMGGPGVDTPQEQQALEAFMQGAQLIRQGAEIDPSTRYIVDKILQDGFLQLSRHYGFEEEGKLALKQAQMQRSRAQGAAVQGQGPMQGPPAPAQGPPSRPPGTDIPPGAMDAKIQY